MQSKRSTPLHHTFAALTRWAANALQSLNPRPALPADPRPWDGTGVCTAVIRGGGTAHTATAALAYTGPDGKEHLKLFRGYNTEGITGHAAASARIHALAFILDNPTGARTTRLFIDDPELRSPQGSHHRPGLLPKPSTHRNHRRSPVHRCLPDSRQGEQRHRQHHRRRRCTPSTSPPASAGS